MKMLLQQIMSKQLYQSFHHEHQSTLRRIPAKMAAWLIRFSKSAPANPGVARAMV